MVQALRRKVAAAIFLLQAGMPVSVAWRLVRDRLRGGRMSAADRDAQEQFVASLGDARLTQTWFLRHVPVWLAIFRRQGFDRRDGLRVLEIGSWEGLSCRFVLDRSPGSVVTCVDTWSGADEQVGQAAADDLAGLEARFDHNTRPYGDRVVKWKGTSQAYFATCSPRECFDLVYIDGSHRADDVLVDAIRGFEALRPGGVMICDDYLWKFYDRAQDNPGAAINAFLRLEKGSYDLIHAGWQVAIVKRR